MKNEKLSQLIIAKNSGPSEKFCSRQDSKTKAFEQKSVAALTRK
jgi:hypothetical protein